MALSWAGPMAPIWLPSALSEVLSATFCKVLTFQNTIDYETAYHLDAFNMLECWWHRNIFSAYIA